MSKGRDRILLSLHQNPCHSLGSYIYFVSAKRDFSSKGNFQIHLPSKARFLLRFPSPVHLCSIYRLEGCSTSILSWFCCLWRSDSSWKLSDENFVVSALRFTAARFSCLNGQADYLLTLSFSMLYWPFTF